MMMASPPQEYGEEGSGGNIPNPSCITDQMIDPMIRRVRPNTSTQLNDRKMMYKRKTGDLF